MTDFSDAFEGVGRAVLAAEGFSVDPGEGAPKGINADGTSDDGAVEVTVTDGTLSAIRINVHAVRADAVRDLEKSVQQAVNQALETYQTDALAALESVNPSFAELQSIVRQTQEQLSTAFRSTMQRAVADGDREAEAGWRGAK